MKTLLLILIFAFCACGQDIEATTADGKIVVLKSNGTWKYKAERPNYKTPPGWKLLVETESSLEGVIYYYKDIKERYGRIEGWVRIEPMFVANYRKKKKLPANFAYYLHYLTLNCEDKRLGFEQVLLYSTTDRIITTNKIYFPSFSNPIVPDSIGEGIWLKLCR